jgi:hypothetical protein
MKVLIRVRYAPVMLFPESVVGRAWIRIPAIPELLYKGFPFLVTSQISEETPFVLSDYVNHILVEPVPVVLRHAAIPIPSLSDAHNTEAGEQNDKHNREKFPEYHISPPNPITAK